MKTLVVTKDRPLQFYGLVNSTKYLGNYAAKVLAKFSTPEIRKLYNLPLQMCFEEEDFREDLLGILEYLDSEFVLLLTDDTFFYRDVYVNQAVRLFDENPDLLTVSLRLGQNTKYQDPEDKSKIINIPVEMQSNSFLWDWTCEPEDRNTGYPISMDGHIYRTKDIFQLSQQIQFTNLREWEGNLINYVRKNKTKRLMACSQYSSCVNIPINMVQYPFQEKVGPFGISNSELLKMFKNGERIDIDETFKDIKIEGCHQYIELKMKKKSNLILL